MITIQYKPVGFLKTHERNPRKIDEADFERLKVSIADNPDYFEVRPILATPAGRVFAGNMRLRAALALGMTEVPVAVMDVSPEKEKELMIRDNVTNGKWDYEILGADFEPVELERYGVDLSDFGGGASATHEDEAPAPPKVPTSKPGEIYELGPHRLLCGDSTKLEDVQRLLDGAKVDICWTDPPWNVAYGKSDNPKYKKREIINDDLGADFPAFCQAFSATIKAVTKPGAALYMAMSAQEWPVIDAALRNAGFHWSATIIWAKDRLVLGRGDYHRQYEPIWYGWNANAARLNPLEDRTQTDVWNIPRPSKSDEHPTMKPVELVARALRNSSKEGGDVFDPFGGSGTTLIAAEQTGRRAFLVELDPAYCDVIRQRYENLQQDSDEA